MVATDNLHFLMQNPTHYQKYPAFIDVIPNAKPQHRGQESSSVYSHIRMHHPTSSCTDNMVRDSGEGGVTMGREQGCVREKERERDRVCGIWQLLDFPPPQPMKRPPSEEVAPAECPFSSQRKTNTWNVKASRFCKYKFYFSINASRRVDGGNV